MYTLGILGILLLLYPISLSFLYVSYWIVFIFLLSHVLMFMTLRKLKIEQKRVLFVGMMLSAIRFILLVFISIYLSFHPYISAINIILFAIFIILNIMPTIISYNKTKNKN